MPRPSLSPQMAVRIIDHIRAHNLQRDQHLPAQALADAFRVSRAPVNAALRQLETMRIVRCEPNRGYFLVKNAQELDRAEALARRRAGEPEDAHYFAIAEDRLSGRLPDRISENELMRL